MGCRMPDILHYVIVEFTNDCLTIFDGIKGCMLNE